MGLKNPKHNRVYPIIPKEASINNLSLPLAVMDESMDDLTASLSSMFRSEDLQRVVEAINSIGINSIEDLKYLDTTDLAGLLKPIEIKKVMAWKARACK